MKKSIVIVLGAVLLVAAAGVNPWSAPVARDAATPASDAGAARAASEAEPARENADGPAEGATDARPARASAEPNAALAAVESTEPVVAAAAAALIADAAAADVVAGAVLETLTGTASYYADYFAGQLTASGEPYNPRELVAAHRTLPFGTVVRVTNEANRRSVIVRIVDRGPFAGGDRIIDLSRRAAERLGFIHEGLARVTVEVLEYGE